MAQGRIQYEITAKDRSAAALKAVRGNIGQVENAVGGLNKLLAPLAAAFSVGVIGSNLVRTNREFQSLKASLVTFTGSVENADRAFGIIRQFASETPFAVSDVVSSFNILIARGINPTVGELKAFGDIASGSGKSFQQLAEAVADAAVGEFERLKEFGIKAGKENDNITFAFANTTKTVTNDAESILAALTEIAEVQFAGATERQAQTLNGAFSNLGDAVDNLFFSIGEAGLSAEITRVTRKITGAIGETDSFARTVSSVLVGAIRTLEDAFEFLGRNIDEIIIGFGVIFGAKLIRNVAATIGAIVNFTKAVAAASVTTTLFKTVSALLTKNLGVTIATIGGGTVAAVAFKDEIAKLVEGITDQIDVTGTIDAVLAALGFTIDDTSSETSKLAGEVAELTAETEIAISTAAAFTKAERDLLDEIRALQPETVNLTSKLATLDSLFVKNEVSTDDLSRITQQLALDYAGLTNPTQTARTEQVRIEEAIKAVTAAGGDNSETLKLLRGRLIDLKAQTEKTYGAGAIKGIKDYYDSISDNSKNAATAVGDAFRSLESDLSQFFQTGKLDFSSFKNAIIKGLADIAAKATVSAGINFLGKVFPSLRFAEGGLVQAYANGGMVRGPGGPKDDKVLARLSDGEFVMNAQSVRRFGPEFFNRLNSGMTPGGQGMQPKIPQSGENAGVPGFFWGGWNPIKWLKKLMNRVRNIVSDVFNSVKDIVGNIAAGIRDTAEGLVKGVLQGDIGSIAKFALPFVLPGIGSGIAGAFGGATGFGSFISGVGSAVSNSFAAGVFGAGSTSSIASSVLTGLLTGGVEAGISKSIQQALGLSLDGMGSAGGQYEQNRASAFAKLVNGASPYLEKRAMGGPLSQGQASIVGENGPEVFIPNRNGTVAAIKGNGADLIGAVNEVRDEISDLRRQMSRVLAGQALVGAR
jgi:hypothetical protein